MTKTVFFPESLLLKFIGRISRATIILATFALWQSALPATEAADAQATRTGSTLTTPRSGQTATRLLDGRVLIVAGYDGTGRDGRGGVL